MKIIQNLPKSFWIGVSVASLICVIALVVHTIVIVSHVKNRDPLVKGDEDEDIGGPLVVDEIKSIFDGAKSRLGIYASAAASTDAGPCAKIATDVMRRNGTVVDGAVAALFCNGVVHAHSMGLGGGFVMTIYIKSEKKSHALIAREMAPKKATMDMFKNNRTASSLGPLSIAVPGELLGYFEAKRRFGNPAVSWASLIEPTIHMCEEGIPMTEAMALITGSALEMIKEDPHLRKVFIDPKTGNFHKVGEKYKHPQLAQTLRRIAANGADEVYGPNGETGKKLVKDIQDAGGIITHDDLTSYNISLEDPVKSEMFNKLTVYTTPPPTSGPVLAGILGVVSQFNMTKQEARSGLSYHRFIEACKYGFAQRSFLGDWLEPTLSENIRKVSDMLSSKEWARKTRHEIRDDYTSQDPGYYGLEVANKKDDGTAHLSFLAPNGDAVSVTSTVNSYFGSRVYSPSTGIILNNQMDDFSTPGFANVYGIEPSSANFIRPGRRPVSSMVPTIIVDENGQVRLIVGASGGPKIITSTAFVTMNHLWFDYNIKEAIDAKRVHHQLLPMQVLHDIGLDEEITSYLKKVGHKVVQLGPLKRGSIVQGIAVTPSGIITANNDLRKSGGVEGF